MHNYANLYKTIHATALLFTSLHLNRKKVHVKFQFDPISSLFEKVVQTDKWTVKTHKVCIIKLIHAKLYLPQTPSCLVLCTLTQVHDLCKISSRSHLQFFRKSGTESERLQKTNILCITMLTQAKLCTPLTNSCLVYC